MDKRKKFFTALIKKAITNQLYQHGHKEYEGSYNPKIDVQTQAEICYESFEESFEEYPIN